MSQTPQVYSKYELIFTPHLIPELKNLRGKEWQQLIDRLSTLPETHPDTLAFSMMMIQLNNCMSCDRDSYRAQRGCNLCAQHTITSYKGSDRQLIQRFETAQRELQQHLPLVIPLQAA